MGRLTVTIAATSVLFAATRAESQSPRDSVVAAVNEFFRAMTARDTAALGRVQFGDGVLYAARVQRDSAAIRRGTFEGFTQQIAGLKDTYVERMWEPTVLVHGPLAVVWAPYDVHRNREFVHCGVDRRRSHQRHRDNPSATRLDSERVVAGFRAFLCSLARTGATRGTGFQLARKRGYRFDAPPTA